MFFDDLRLFIKVVTGWLILGKYVILFELHHLNCNAL